MKGTIWKLDMKTLWNKKGRRMLFAYCYVFITVIDELLNYVSWIRMSNFCSSILAGADSVKVCHPTLFSYKKSLFCMYDLKLTLHFPFVFGFHLSSSDQWNILL